jgi:hypothetical protein
LSTALRYLKEKGQSLKVENNLFGDAELRDGVNHAIDGEIFINNGTLNIFSKFTNQSRNTFTGFNGVNPSRTDELSLSMSAYSVGTDKTFKLGKNADLKVSGGWHLDNWTEVALIPQFKLTADGKRLITDEMGMPVADTIQLFRDGEVINTSFFIDGQGADTRSLDGEIQFTSRYHANNHIVAGIYLADDKIVRAQRLSELNLMPLMFVPFNSMTDASNNWLFDLHASRKTLAGFVQMDYNLTEHLNIAGGARLDSYSGTGTLTAQKYNELNPRASIVYSITDDNTIKLLYGTATRIPNGFETLSSVSILGTPENRPERIRTYQMQWIKNWAMNLRTEIGAFRSSISNRLETNASISDELRAQGFIGQFVNTAAPENQKNHGIDGKLITRINNSTVSLNVTKYFASNDGHGNPIAYIPNTMANLDYSAKVNTLTLSAGLNYRAGFTKNIADTREVVKDYLIARANFILQPMNSSFGYRLTFRNMLNAKYAYPSSSLDFPNHFPARRIEVSAGITFKAF